MKRNTSTHRKNPHAHLCILWQSSEHADPLHSAWACSWQALEACVSVLFLFMCVPCAISGSIQPRKSLIKHWECTGCKISLSLARSLSSLFLPSPLRQSSTLPYALHAIKKSWKKSITHLTGFNDCTWRSWGPMSHAASGNTVPFYCFVTTDSRGILIHFWWNVAFKSLHLSSASWSCLLGLRTILMWALCCLKA